METCVARATDEWMPPDVHAKVLSIRDIRVIRGSLSSVMIRNTALYVLGI
jgi:hypothetical protein